MNDHGIYLDFGIRQFLQNNLDGGVDDSTSFHELTALLICTCGLTPVKPTGGPAVPCLPTPSGTGELGCLLILARYYR